MKKHAQNLRDHDIAAVATYFARKCRGLPPSEDRERTMDEEHHYSAASHPERVDLAISRMAALEARASRPRSREIMSALFALQARKTP
jgi:hypothetical protein